MKEPHARFYPWSSIIERLRQRPERWSLELPAAPVRTAKHVRLRRHPDLRLDDGTIEAYVVNAHRDEDGRERGDIFLRFVPTGHK